MTCISQEIVRYVLQCPLSMQEVPRKGQERFFIPFTLTIYGPRTTYKQLSRAEEMLLSTALHSLPNVWQLLSPGTQARTDFYPEEPTRGQCPFWVMAPKLWPF